MHITLIPSTMLPFPPVKGGAVQNLIKSFIDWNEENSQDYITVYSIYNEKAESEAHHWKYCQVKFIRIPGLFFRLRESNNRFFERAGFYLIHKYYTLQLSKELREDTNVTDLVILENTPQFAETVTKFSHKKLYIHIYNDYLNKDTRNIEDTLSKTQKVITVSDYISNRVKETGLIDNKKVITLHNGVELERFGTEKSFMKRNQLRSRYHIPEDSVVFIFVARLVPEKGIKELLLAFNKIIDSRAHLVVVGNKLYGGNITDPFLLELKRIAESKKEQIHFTGYIDYQELPDYYAMADIGVLPSLYEEPFALAAIEYMATGLAVILSDAGGFPEMAEGDSAIIVQRGEKMVDNLYNAMMLLLDDNKILEDYQSRGKKRSELFSSSAYCEGLNQIIRD